MTSPKKSRMEAMAILDVMGEGILAMDPDGAIVMVNRQIQRIFGYESKELLGKNLQQLLIHRSGQDV